MRKNRPEIYRAAERFVADCLRRDGSLFTPSHSLWSAPVAEDLYHRFNQQPDTSSDKFEVKLRRQLAGAPDPTFQLMAEAVYVQFLVVDDIGGKAKRALVQQILGWMKSAAEIPPDLDAAFDHGLAGGGLAFKTLRPFQIQFLVDFARVWKALPAEDRDRALGDPWRFKEILWQVPINSGYAQREALLHLVFPDVFEDIVSREHKQQIATAFATYVSEPTDDVDRRLLQIRRQLEKQFGPHITYYDPELWPRWNAVASDARLWDSFIAWGKRFRELPIFEEDERLYKIRVAEDVGAAREAVLSNDAEWQNKLEAAFRSKDNNLTRWQANDSFRKWITDHPDEARQALRALWSTSGALFERLKSFVDSLPPDLLSGSDLLRVMSFLLMGEDPKKYPPVTASVLAKACELTGYPAPPPASDEARRYRHGLAFLDRLAQEAQKRAAPIRDRLDAQAMAYAVVQYDPPQAWPDEDKRAFRAWRDGAPPEVVKLSDEVKANLTLQQLADEMYLPEDFLADVVALLLERKQIVIYGPPGTGKTHVARKLAAYLAPTDKQRDIVQFHPSYSYEDFVEGFRPVADSKQLRYELRPGPLRRLADRAREHDHERHVLVVDEINRGNLPRILGELLFAMEYRGEPVRLMYGGDDTTFSLPANLLIVGTMNTADRSIGLIDAALRRRFHFVPMFPGEGPLAGLLAHWLDKNCPQMAEVATIVDKLNQRLRLRVGRHLQLGHSYFLRRDLSQDVLTQIWDNDVMPFLEDQFFGKEEELDEYRLERLRVATDGSNPDDQAQGTAE